MMKIKINLKFKNNKMMILIMISNILNLLIKNKFKLKINKFTKKLKLKKIFN